MVCGIHYSHFSHPPAAQKVKISVVIPAYNESGYIDACLEAFLNQTVQPYEIIIVDNNSTDDTVMRAQQYDFVRVMAEPRQGISYARDAGFDAATGDIIARCDIDTHVGLNWISELDAFFTQAPNVGGVSGPAHFYDVWRPIRRLVNLLFLDSYYWITRRATGSETLFGSNCALRRSAWEAVRANVCHDDAKIHEDIDLSQHLLSAGFKLAYDPKLKVGISARPLARPVGMVKRWRKGLTSYARHR